MSQRGGENQRETESVSQRRRENKRETERDICSKTLAKTRGTRLIGQGVYRMRLVLLLTAVRQGSESFEHASNGLGGVRHGLQMRDEPLCLVVVVKTVSGLVEVQSEEEVPEENRAHTHTHNTHTQESTHRFNHTHMKTHTVTHTHTRGRTDSLLSSARAHTHTHTHVCSVLTRNQVQHCEMAAGV